MSSIAMINSVTLAIERWLQTGLDPWLKQVYRFEQAQAGARNKQDIIRCYCRAAHWQTDHNYIGAILLDDKITFVHTSGSSSHGYIRRPYIVYSYSHPQLLQLLEVQLWATYNHILIHIEDDWPQEA